MSLRIWRLDYHGFKVGHKSRDWYCKKRRKYTQRHTEKARLLWNRDELTQPHPRTAKSFWDPPETAREAWNKFS